MTQATAGRHKWDYLNRVRKELGLRLIPVTTYVETGAVARNMLGEEAQAWMERQEQMAVEQALAADEPVDGVAALAARRTDTLLRRSLDTEPCELQVAKADARARLPCRGTAEAAARSICPSRHCRP